MMKKLILNLYLKKQTKFGVRVRSKIKAHKRSQVILYKLYYTSYIVYLHSIVCAVFHSKQEFRRRIGESIEGKDLE